MKLSTRSRYGIRMLADIARQGSNQVVTLQEVAVRQNISFKYLEKITRILKDAGYLSGKKGPNGGHRLNRFPQDILIGDLVIVLEGNLELVDCKNKDNPCPRLPNCRTHQVWEDLKNIIHQKLNTISLADLIHDEEECDHLFQH
jgi:Rrf2 family protein